MVSLTGFSQRHHRVFRVDGLTSRILITGFYPNGQKRRKHEARGKADAELFTELTNQVLIPVPFVLLGLDWN